MFLSHEKRREVRTLIGNLTQSHSTLEKALRKGEDIPSRLSRRLESLTQTIEPANQLTALESIIHDVRGSYLEKLRQLAPDDLTAYAEYINPDEPPAPHHVWMCDRLMELEQKEILRMTISMPPGHAKSTYASRIFPSWVMGRNPKNRYIQAGHTTNFCENEFGKKTKTIIESDAFRSVFPEVELAVDAKAAGYWALARFGGSYLTRGVGQGISGFRAHVAAVDDPFASREDAESQTVRNKVYDWFMADFTTRLLPYCPMFVVATRWHSDDLIGRIEDLNKKGIGLPWYIINLPAVCDDVNDAMGRELDEPLWPDFYTLDSLMTLKATLPPRDWNSLYMGKPVDEEGGVIEAAWLKRFSTIPKPSDVRRVTVSVDSASKDTQRADYTVIGVWYELMNGNHYLVHLDRDRMELPALVKRIETIATHWEASAILVEDKGSGTQYIQLRSQQAPCPVVAIAVDNNSKQFRFDGVAPMFEAGKVHIPDHGIWVPDYERELLGFPNAKYDDQVDMTSQYLTWVRKKRRLGQQKLKGHGLATSQSSEKMSPKKAKVMKEIEKNIDLIRQKHEDDPIRVALRTQAVRDLMETRKGPG